MQAGSPPTESLKDKFSSRAIFSSSICTTPSSSDQRQSSLEQHHYGHHWKQVQDIQCGREQLPQSALGVPPTRPAPNPETGLLAVPSTCKFVYKPSPLRAGVYTVG